jgi:hypothetical protein
MNSQKKRKRMLELAMSFWTGIGLMSIINVWKISESMHAKTYSWIMFAVAVLFVAISIIYLISINQQTRNNLK